MLSPAAASPGWVLQLSSLLPLGSPGPVWLPPFSPHSVTAATLCTGMGVVRIRQALTPKCLKQPTHGRSFPALGIATVFSGWPGGASLFTTPSPSTKHVPMWRLQPLESHPAAAGWSSGPVGREVLGSTFPPLVRTQSFSPAAGPRGNPAAGGPLGHQIAGQGPWAPVRVCTCPQDPRA